MDIEKVKSNNLARESRDRRPISAFMELYSATDSALKEVAELGASEATKETLVKSHLINVVTAVEVYYRDMLDSVFRLCKPELFEGKLKNLHDKSYKIDDLLAIYVNRIHPLELVASNLSFQNIGNIEKVFSTLIGKPFFKQAKQLKWRLKEKPETECEINHSDIDTLQEVFEERHLLIHNPNGNLSASLASTEERINSIFGVVMASDLVLTQFINENIDPEISSNKSSNADGDKAAAGS
ncbi:hypothetical protein [Zhongshania sp. BJYM1]|uniref:hypothetical protein n=1 Tax=Zhongshania aquatica TaxID=2965069 RepID=UPI0022B50E92|nr:hypothetical protein [Marortus sp. BJYM1]